MLQKDRVRIIEMPLEDRTPYETIHLLIPIDNNTQRI